MKSKLRFLITLTTLFYSLSTFAQQKFTISGYIKDAGNGEELLGAAVIVKGKGGTVTNIYGFYSLTIEQGVYDIEYSYIGYETKTEKVNLNKNTTITINLSRKDMNLQEVVITGEAQNKNVSEVKMSTVNLKMETIKKIPALMGEVDVIRAIQMLPGVQSGGEGSTGFFVRGGGADQNLVLLDEATVYNASHLLGFFSVFNQDAIKDVQLYKGGISSEYGGRLSSVLDIRMKDGNDKNFQASGGIGLISSRLTVEGPLVEKGKGSFIVSGRRTYADLFLKLSSEPALKNNQLYFWDLNGKVSYKLGEKDRVFLSAYTGKDKLGIRDVAGIGWGNQTVTARWNHLYNARLFSNLTLIFSNFNYNIGIPNGELALDWISRIRDYSVKNDYTYYLNTKNTIKFGFQSTLHQFKPGEIIPGEDNKNVQPFELPEKRALENAIYANNEMKIGSRIIMQYGLRFSLFSNIGRDTIYQFDNNYDTIGFKAYEKGDFFNTYTGLEPRFSIKYSIDDESSIKASYNRMFQYLHLASNSTNSAPYDIWVPSSANIKPQMADQVALGYFRNFKNNAYEASVEVYYKDITNQIDFTDRAELLANKLIEGEIRAGKANSIGLELFIKKQTGKLTGWISYTLSKTTRTIDGINNGKTYLSNYDRRNNLSIVASYEINKRLSFSANFIYMTGAPFTAPVGRYSYGGMIISRYSDRNSSKMPDFHRMDVSLTLKNKKKKEDQKFESDWNFSVYNVYNKKNPFTLNFKQNPDAPDETQAEMTYLFGIIPSITYNFKF